jgi:WD40 repeat protein
MRKWCIAGALAVLGAFAPPSAHAGTIAAYDRYVTGRGFDIALINANTGAAIGVPASVNTADDELHPALSPDGRYIVFTRMRLLPDLNGNILPPATRTLFRVDRQTGEVVQLAGGGAAGPVIRQVAGTPRLAWGVTHFANGSSGTTVVSRAGAFTGGALTGTEEHIASLPAGPAFTTHAAVTTAPEDDGFGNVFQRPLRTLGIAYIDNATGALQNGLAHLTTKRVAGGAVTSIGREKSFGSATQPAGHPVPRVGDDLIAFEMGNGNLSNIKTFRFGIDQNAVDAPAAINTVLGERMPAWSTDGSQLGFVRTALTGRVLGLFDTTPGIQNLLNDAVSLGNPPPTPQTVVFQNVWGGISLAPSGSTDLVSCASTCTSLLGAGTLTPRITTTTATNIGILVVRVVGKHRLFGETVPKIKPVGRVPLGRARDGRNRFRWDATVDGKRLKAGTYLLTYRLLGKKDRIVGLSDSIRFKVTKSGDIKKPRRQK